ncbi:MULTISPECIES: GNAT family protein [Planococcus]|uniref:GNAT family N-acetyltransferase n=1 Tax=Planococcus faecalis TaxID=1598147 RepID=A0ABN4XMB6_9BACL|nr:MULTISPECIES: GNAT family protein [Planococcus]AQU80816.1 GNAT family N-acetyltransferase [Planococcus faecalis]MDJ0332270.1 GNAT family protein [Planococcus sp. S3-L1]
MLETNRFYLREFIKEDWKAVHAYASQEIVTQYQPWGPNTEKETQQYLVDVLEQQVTNPRTSFTFAVVWKQTNEVIGAGELSAIDNMNQSGEIGYILHPNFWRRGIAAEVTLLLLEFGFRNKELNRISASCDLQNSGSQNVLEKSGMVKEGLLRQNLRMKKGWRDSLLYSILKTEYMS